MSAVFGRYMESMLKFWKVPRLSVTSKLADVESLAAKEASVSFIILSIRHEDDMQVRRTTMMFKCSIPSHLFLSFLFFPETRACQNVASDTRAFREV